MQPSWHMKAIMEDSDELVAGHPKAGGKCGSDRGITVSYQNTVQTKITLIKQGENRFQLAKYRVW